MRPWTDGRKGRRALAANRPGGVVALRTVCKAHGVTLCYLFGSQSENAWRILLGEEIAIDDPLTDIDVGVVLAEFDSYRASNVLYRVYARLLSPLEDLFHPYPVDLVFLQEHHSVFQMEAISGRSVYSVSDEYRFEYEEEIARRAADFRPVLYAYFEDVAEGFRESYTISGGVVRDAE
ncbi:MAG: nucleotidyltransferase domain-containing protein [Clostridia bacterium]|nr:nucleotidyltransferase domain-containing protein [Clostridia bacterium]